MFLTSVQACANSGSHTKAQEFYVEMRREGLSPNTRTFGKLMEAAAKAASLKDAERWFSELKSKFPEEIGQIQYIMLIDAAAREGDLITAEKWFQHLNDSGNILDRRAYHGVMSAAAKAGDMKTSKVWLQKMSSNNLTPNEMTFIAVAEACVEEGNLDAAMTWLGQGDPSQRIMATAQVALNAIRSGRHAIAEELLKTPRDDKDESIKAISQEALTLRCLALKELVKLYLDLGHLEKAQDWLQAAEEICCEKDIFRKMYLEMLKACASKGNLMKAEKIFFQAHKAFKGFQDLTFYTLMVDAAGKGKDLRAAEKWFEKALDAGMEPDIVLFTSMVDAAFRSGDVRAAEYWQSRSSNAGCVANKVMLSTLVKGCAQAGYKEKALRWATQALESLEAGDDLVILNCIIDIHAKNADPSSLKEATLALEKIRSPDERSFGPIINAHAEKGNYEEALKYFRRQEGPQGG